MCNCNKPKPAPIYQYELFSKDPKVMYFCSKCGKEIKDE